MPLGMDIEEVKQRIEKTADRDEIYILTETLEYLKRGGRISPAVATVGNLLKIKPVLLLKNPGRSAYTARFAR